MGGKALIRKLISFFKGYLEITAQGYFLERFLNLCLMDDILLYDLSRENTEKLSAKINISSFKKLRVIARKTRTRIQINKKFGFTFFIQKNKNRRGICIGVFLFILIIYFFSTHLMGISLVGNNKISDDELFTSLLSYGVKIGVPVNSINTKKIKNQLMTSNPDLGWVGISLKGSRLYLEIKERKEKKEIPGTNEPCNLVASKNGIVRLMEIRDGQTMVIVNTPVKKGDLLVSGVIDSNSVGMRYTHSYGEVYATTWYKENINIPLEYKTKIFTQEKKTKRIMKFLNTSVPLYFSKEPSYSHYKTHTSTKEYSLPINIFPSIKLEKTEYFKQKEQNKERTLNEAITLGKFHLLHRINSQISDGASIDKVRVSHQKTGNIVSVTLECECTENIAKKTPIDKTEDLEYNEDNYK